MIVSPRQIIVADDDKTVRTVICHALTRQGYQVRAAPSIAGLWDITSAQKGEVLITDVGFPDGDVLELMPRLQEKRSDLVIIVMSARANFLTAIKAQQHNVFDYLPKPFELKQLLDVVARAVLHENRVEQGGGHERPGFQESSHQEAGYQGASFQGIGHEGVDLHEVGHQGYGLHGAGHQEDGIQKAGHEGADIHRVGHQGAGIQEAGLQGYGHEGVGIQGAGIQKAGHEGAGFQEFSHQGIDIQGVEHQLILPKHLPAALMGKSPAMQMTFKQLAKLSAHKGPVLITAEAGSKKLSVAKIVHEMGPLSNEPFKEIGLLQGEDAQQDEMLFGKAGYFAKYPACVYFINDIERLSATAQKRLAHLIEIANIASNTLPAIPRLQIIAGTTADLNLLVGQGAFNRDLFTQLSAAQINLPPLRERYMDIPHIAQHYGAQASQQVASGQVTDQKFTDQQVSGGQATSQEYTSQEYTSRQISSREITSREIKSELVFEAEAMGLLQAYHWPGNIGELEVFVNRLLANGTPSKLSAPLIQQQLDQISATAGSMDSENFSQAVEQHISRFFKNFGEEDIVMDLHRQLLAEIEKPLIKATLQHTTGNQIKAAKILGVNRNTLRKKMKDLNMSSKRADYR